MNYEFTVIGGGSAGFNGAVQAVKLGLRTAVIDGAQELGGLCILRGCMPSKALIAAANRVLDVERCPAFGLHPGTIRREMAELAQRKRRLIAGFADERRAQLENGGFDLIRGNARFVGENTLAVEGLDGETRMIESRTFLIATGSVHRRIEVDGLEEAGYWTSDEALEAEVVPKSLVVLGGGAVALEMAHFFNAMGAEVTVVQRGRQILSSADRDVAECVERVLARRGVRFFKGTRLRRVVRTGEQVRVEFETVAGVEGVRAEQILKALGRKPATSELGLGALGVKTLPDGGVVRGRTGQTSRSHIFAAGDASADVEVVHEAVMQGEMAARNAWRMCRDAGEALEEMDARARLFVVFTNPEVAMVGLTEWQAAASGRRVRVAKYRYEDHGKAIVDGFEDGFVKLIAEEEGGGGLLGAAAVGHAASELIHVPAAFIALGRGVRDLLRIPMYHPTLTEIWTHPAEALLDSEREGKS